MAKVGASIVGILTFLLVIYNINLCATNPIEETEKHVNLDIKNQYQNIQNATEPLSIQQQQQQQPTTIIKAATNADKTTTADGSIPYINRPLLGVNGTGQRKDITDILANGSTTTTTVQIQQPEQTKTDETKKTAGSQFPKKVLTATNTSPTLTQTSINTNKSSTEIKSKEESAEETPVEKLIDTIDVPENETLTEIGKHNLTINQKTDHHDYYNSSIYYDKTEADRQWDEIKNISPNWMLSTSHRRAMTVVLSFDFPFYGHSVRNVTVATGGFIYTGDYVHSWLAATQYIAPLMANFDTSISNDSFVKLNDTGSSFTVIWQNVYLQDRQDVGKFTFSTTLHANGDISFTYFSVPVLVTSIHDDKHPVKVGLSDAYIIDKVVYYARRKTIYEYHRVNFANSKISNSTLIYLKALPTCLQYTDCASCLNNETTFTCFWCPILNRCSTGTDRKKQDWLAKGCDKSPISNADHCPAVGQKGIEQPISSTVATPLDEAHSELHTAGSGTQMKSMLDSADDHRGDNKSMNVTLGLFVPICLVACVLMWVLYAYRNPHTKSGQLLIQYRPSQWSWRRGEARYTAATIHM